MITGQSTEAFTQKHRKKQSFHLKSEKTETFYIPFTWQSERYIQFSESKFTSSKNLSQPFTCAYSASKKTVFAKESIYGDIFLFLTAKNLLKLSTIMTVTKAMVMTEPLRL
ncbi:MAG: hypothetical protein GY710_27375 [Desulfobacteraceae bacterium]|nr:hypothetical protein [Desulfobacteraceae bacterium]